VLIEASPGLELFVSEEAPESEDTSICPSQPATSAMHKGKMHKGKMHKGNKSSLAKNR
jgi:hypothetical protein